MGKKGQGYRLKGSSISGRGRDLASALEELWDSWSSRPSLAMHAYGAVKIEINVGGQVAIFEVTDQQIIDEIQNGNSDYLVEIMAEKSNATLLEMQAVLRSADNVTVSVDKIRNPHDENYWTPEQGTELEVVLPSVIFDWASRSARETASPVDRMVLTKLTAVIGKQEGKSIAQISRETGIPRTTLWDALNRGEGGVKPERKAPRMSREQEAVVREEQKEKLFELVSTGISATGAARKLGIPERTARGWVKKQREIAAEQAEKEKEE